MAEVGKLTELMLAKPPPNEVGLLVLASRTPLMEEMVGALQLLPVTRPLTLLKASRLSSPL